jgi:hypothetical protein
MKGFAIVVFTVWSFGARRWEHGLVSYSILGDSWLVYPLNRVRLFTRFSEVKVDYTAGSAENADNLLHISLLL